jgi:hypothetical protein
MVLAGQLDEALRRLARSTPRAKDETSRGPGSDRARRRQARWTFDSWTKRRRVLAALLKNAGHAGSGDADGQLAGLGRCRSRGGRGAGGSCAAAVFFTAEQIAHALASAGSIPLLAARADGGPLAAARLRRLQRRRRVARDGAPPARPAPMPAGTAKITFTSGTTGSPRASAWTARACAVPAGWSRPWSLDIRRHLCALPFAVLLENIAGLMAPWRAERPA